MQGQQVPKTQDSKGLDMVKGLKEDKGVMQ
jgi:hypothetical protein